MIYIAGLVEWADYYGNLRTDTMKVFSNKKKLDKYLSLHKNYSYIKRILK